MSQRVSGLPTKVNRNWPEPTDARCAATRGAKLSDTAHGPADPIDGATPAKLAWRWRDGRK